ncbi:MAG: ABC transporter permease [Ignavibacteriaceae bacterium]|nr:ABC transporter permease [Ignavibacteriaceae bacterium]
MVKEFQQFKRDPKMFGIILIAPVVQLIFLGYAATLDLKFIRLAIFDQDNSRQSRELVKELEAGEIFIVEKYLSSYSELEENMQSGRILVSVVIPDDYEKKLLRRETANLQLIVNGSDGNAASIATGYLSKFLSMYSQKYTIHLFEESGMRPPPIGTIIAEPRVWFNPLLVTRVYMVPSIVGLLLSIITLILTALAIVKEKEIGTYEQIIVTPIKPYQLILGKLIPFIILAYAAALIGLAAMWIVFGIPVKGSFSFLLISSFFYILSTLGLGLFVSTISKTQQQAMMIAIFAVLLPMVYLSGFAFPLDNAPLFVQIVSYFIPLTYFFVVIRGVILQGNGFIELWDEALIMLLMGVLILLASAIRFRKKLD